MKGELEAMTPRWLGKDLLRIPAVDDKAGHACTIPLHPKARAAIRAQLAGKVVDLDRPIFGTFSFHQARGRTHPLGGIFERAVELAGIDAQGLTPHHVTRHTAATIAGAQPEASLSGMMRMFRWTSPQMVARYLHGEMEAARAMVEAM